MYELQDFELELLGVETDARCKEEASDRSKFW